MLGPNSFKKAIEEAEKLSESLKLRSLLILSFYSHDARAPRFGLTLLVFIWNRYEEVEVRKKLEEKERLEEKKKREEETEKRNDRSSPKSSATNRKDSKKVKLLSLLFKTLNVM